MILLETMLRMLPPAESWYVNRGFEPIRIPRSDNLTCAVRPTGNDTLQPLDKAVLEFVVVRRVTLEGVLFEWGLVEND